MVYGLNAEGENVRAAVFARKLTALIKALETADRIANGRKRQRFVIDALEKHSAFARIRGQATTRRAIRSASDTLSFAFSAIYKGSSEVSKVSPKLITLIDQMSSGVEKSFSHAEAIDSDNNVIRIDEFFRRQLSSAREQIQTLNEMGKIEYFMGVSHEVFDGTLKLIDSRGELVKAILNLTAGQRTIDCVLKRSLLDEALQKFERRARIAGRAIYAHGDFLPQRLEVSSISPIAEGGDLTRWKGKFRIPSAASTDAWGDP